MQRLSCSKRGIHTILKICVHYVIFEIDPYHVEWVLVTLLIVHFKK